MEIRGEGIIRHQLKCLFVYVSQAKLRRKACVDFQYTQRNLNPFKATEITPHYSQEKQRRRKAPGQGHGCSQPNKCHTSLSVSKQKQECGKCWTGDWEGGGGMGEREKRQEGEREGALQPVLLLGSRLVPTQSQLRKGHSNLTQERCGTRQQEETALGRDLSYYLSFLLRTPPRPTDSLLSIRGAENNHRFLPLRELGCEVCITNLYKLLRPLAKYDEI